MINCKTCWHHFDGYLMWYGEEEGKAHSMNSCFCFFSKNFDVRYEDRPVTRPCQHCDGVCPAYLTIERARAVFVDHKHDEEEDDV